MPSQILTGNKNSLRRKPGISPYPLSSSKWSSAPWTPNPRCSSLASFIGEELYYSTILQLGGLKVHNSKASIPCCGKRTNQEGIFCHSCFIWQHLECLNLPKPSLKSPYLCPNCQANKTCWDLDIGAISDANRIQRRDTGCLLLNFATGLLDTFQPRALQPVRFRLDLQMIEWPKPRGNMVDYIILFNGLFSGLAYALEGLGVRVE